ncbi:MAG: formate dehydrogenase accessory protein FdhE [Thermodesulfobacteriota bacterium]|nr:formate dehydrogenase accessory protein FdhE [Thermodesulfobacteriota bacterium]
MIERKSLGSGQIKKAVAAAKKARPEYERLLDFYEKLLMAQEASMEETHLKAIEIPPDLLSIKQKEGFPLINTNDFAIDIAASESLFRKFCQFAAESNEVLAKAAKKIVASLDQGELELSDLFSKILAEDDTYWDEMERRLDVDKKILAFVAYSSIRPSLHMCSDQLAAYLHKDKPWAKGYCPICGSPPALSILRGEGERFLLCSFCGHEWWTHRVYCPFCENRDQKTMHYFFSEEEKDRRVDVCDQCQKYIKTIDTRKMQRPMHPYVEQVSTLHLDMLAQEKGLESGIPLWLQT